MTYNEKRRNYFIRKGHMEHFNTITKLIGIKDQNITIKGIVNCETHKEIISSLDYDAPNCPACGKKMGKYDFHKASKIPYLDCVGFKCRILLKSVFFFLSQFFLISHKMVSSKFSSEEFVLVNYFTIIIIHLFLFFVNPFT